MPMKASESPSDCDQPDVDPVRRNPQTGGVIIRMGELPEFEMPADAAVKFAMLLIKQAGYEVRGEVAPTRTTVLHKAHLN